MLKKSNLKSLFILLFTLMMALNLNTFLFKVQAGPNVPEQNPKNGWHWGVDVGDQMYYDAEFILSNATTGDIIQMFKDIWIYNITSIENVTVNWLGMNDFSQVNITQCYYNLTSDALEPYEDSREFALFGYNDTDAMKLKYRAGQNGMAMLLPLNGSNTLEVDIMDDILNESYYYPYGQSGTYNQYDHFESDPISNRIYFSNSTDGFFSEGFYYDNGTLERATAYLMVSMGDGPIYINTTFVRVFNYDITDEIGWSVNVGDDLFYDFYEGSDWIDDAMDVKLHITDISNVMLEKTKNWFGDAITYMIYQVVFADIYDWNGTGYELVEVDEPIGMANNFYPQYFDEMGPSLMFLYPTNLQRSEFEFMWNNDTVNIWPVPFDEITYHENGYIETYLRNSTGNEFADVVVDKSTGKVQSFLMHDDSYTTYYELKYQTLVDWSLNVGDTFYYKSNEDGPKDIRVTVSESHTVYVNMTELAIEYSSIGVTMPMPPGQPEFQFFSYLEGEYEIWEPSTESWSAEGSNIFAIANIFWPISPLIFDVGGPPLLVPESTEGSDMNNLFEMFSPVYDDISYTTDTVILHNSTEDKTLYYHFDTATGRNIMMHGWATIPIPGAEWNFISIYTKKVETLSTGHNQFTLQSDFTLDISVSLDFDVHVGGPLPQYIYSVIPFDPVNVTLPNGTALIFFDQLITNYEQIDGNLTFTIVFPSTIDLSHTKLFFFAYNTSGTEEWNSPPPDFYDNIVYNYTANSITLISPPWGPGGMISAFAYIDLSQIPGIPGYEPLILLIISAISIAGVISIYRKKLIH